MSEEKDDAKVLEVLKQIEAEEREETLAPFRAAMSRLNAKEAA
jgi:hypothetical protein